MVLGVTGDVQVLMQAMRSTFQLTLIVKNFPSEKLADT